MILDRGTATTEEEIITEYETFLATKSDKRPPAQMRRLQRAPVIMRNRIGKPISQWSDDEILRLYADRDKDIGTSYSTFVIFLFWRGYRRATINLLDGMHTYLCKHWRPVVAPYRQKIEQTIQSFGYTLSQRGSILNLLLWFLAMTLKPLNEVTRVDFDAFREEYDSWYRKMERRQNHRPDFNLYRLERCLIQWGIINPAKSPLNHEQFFARVMQPSFRTAIFTYLTYCEAKFEESTVKNARNSILIFFIWLQEQYADYDRLDQVTRSVALAYAHHLKQQVEKGTYTKNSSIIIYGGVRQFFTYAISEDLDTAPLKNPFGKDIPKNPNRVPRYLTDHEVQTLLKYCEKEATLLEKVLLLTLLHTGIRAGELASLKVTDLVQVQGKWKVHIHEGKGLKDRVIPLTNVCFKVLQEWKETSWNQVSDLLFTSYGRPWRNTSVEVIIREVGRKLEINELTPHRLRHTFAVALLNYGVRESALQKLMGHASLTMTLEYARILDQTVEKGFESAIEQMQEGPHHWVPSFFSQQEYTLFAEGDTVSWIQLPVGFCRRNPKLHCESDVKCFLCERFYGTPKDLPRLQQMLERFLSLGLTLKANVVAEQIQQIEKRVQGNYSGEGQPLETFIPIDTLKVAVRQ